MKSENHEAKENDMATKRSSDNPNIAKIGTIAQHNVELFRQFTGLTSCNSSSNTTSLQDDENQSDGVEQILTLEKDEKKEEYMEIDWNDIEIIQEEIGKGNYCCVHKVKYLNREFALKHLQKQRLSNLINPDSEAPSKSGNALSPSATAILDLVLEAELLTYLRHPNIIHLYGTKAGPLSKSIPSVDEPFFLLLEYVPNTLDQLLSQWRRSKRRRQKMLHQPTSTSARPPSFTRRLLGRKSRSENGFELIASESSSSRRRRRRPSRGSSSHVPLLHDGTYYDGTSRDLGSIPSMVDRIEFIALGIARGMHYLHENNVIFRDLKPQNIGVFRRHPRNHVDYDPAAPKFQVRIFDFGVARDLTHVEGVYSNRSSQLADKNKEETGDGETAPKDKAQAQAERKLLSRTGTLRYMANEVGAGQVYGLSADVYSFGIVLWEICTLERAYGKMKNRQDYKTMVVRQGNRPPLGALFEHDRLRDFIQQCWHPDPDRRPTFAQICQKLELWVATEREAERIHRNRVDESYRNHDGFRPKRSWLRQRPSTSSTLTVGQQSRRKRNRASLPPLFRGLRSHWSSNMKAFQKWKRIVFKKRTKKEKKLKALPATPVSGSGSASASSSPSEKTN